MSFGGMKGMDLRMVPYGRDIKPEGDTHDVSDTDPVYRTREPPVEPVVMNPKPTSKIKYRDCMRNHAAAIGGHANDGCGEFMPSAAGPLTCAACGCHRNFHRKEIQGAAANHHRSMLHSAPPPMLSYNSVPTTKKFGGFTTMGPGNTHRNGGGLFGDDDLRDHHDEVDRRYDRRSETPERGEVLGTAGAMSAAAVAARNKRFRTKFTQEQKEKMLEFAEKLGWRIQKQDDVALNQFCSEIGVKRNVLKVWMHNNKNAHRRRESAPASLPPPPIPPAPPQPVDVGV